PATNNSLGKFASWERAVEKRINDLEKKLLNVLSKHRGEVDDGFSSLQGSMETMKAIIEGKRRLTEDVLREEIEDIRKLFVLV
ncbi:protein FAM81A-like, partial [Convolutriloba macropyga]|uniref:protein FAM81A-like n=1 Tax=Convolutriloba macropyga TaxID=536237 RepID=UPI003F51F910